VVAVDGRLQEAPFPAALEALCLEAAHSLEQHSHTEHSLLVAQAAVYQRSS